MEYVIDDRILKVIIHRKNNKNIYVRINEDLQIVVTCNHLIQQQEIINLLNANSKMLSKMLKQRVKQKERNEQFYYFGQIYDIIVVPAIDEIDIVENYIYVKDNKMLDKWVTNESQKVFLRHYNYWYNCFTEDIPYYQLRLRKMKTRWGVCNKKSKTITLNANLFKYDIMCLDYVIIHELSHLVYFDHSKNFWDLVFKNYPNYKQAKKLLK